VRAVQQVIAPRLHRQPAQMKQVLRHELANQPQAACSQREADGEFAAARDRAHQKKIGYIGAGKQQQHRGQRQQNRQAAGQVDIGPEWGTPKWIGGDGVAAAMRFRIMVGIRCISRFNSFSTVRR